MNDIYIYIRTNTINISSQLICSKSWPCAIASLPLAPLRAGAEAMAQAVGGDLEGAFFHKRIFIINRRIESFFNGSGAEPPV